MNCSWNCLFKIVLLNSITMWILFLSHSFRLKVICWQCPFVSRSRISVDNHRMVLFERKCVAYCHLYLFLFQSWPHIRLLPHVLWLHSTVGRPCCFSDRQMAYQWSVFLWVRLRLCLMAYQWSVFLWVRLRLCLMAYQWSVFLWVRLRLCLMAYQWSVFLWVRLRLCLMAYQWSVFLWVRLTAWLFCKFR